MDQRQDSLYRGKVDQRQDSLYRGKVDQRHSVEGLRNTKLNFV